MDQRRALPLHDLGKLIRDRSEWSGRVRTGTVLPIAFWQVVVSAAGQTETVREISWLSFGPREQAKFPPYDSGTQENVSGDVGERSPLDDERDITTSIEPTIPRLGDTSRRIRSGKWAGSTCTSTHLVIRST